MKAIFATLLGLVLQSSAAESLTILAGPQSWSDSLPLVTKDRSALVLDTPLQTQLRGYACPRQQKLPLTEKEIRSQVAEISGELRNEAYVDFKIDWLFTETPTDFSRTILPAEGVIRSTCRVGGAKITRTVIADSGHGTIFIHLLADKPGALSFRLILSDKEGNLPNIQNRKEMVLPAGDKPGSLGAHAWVIPFESDVTPEKYRIVVRGEGEAMILLTYAKGPLAAQSLADTLKRLGDRYDPGQSPSDPTKIWQGALESRMKSVENSP